MFQSNLSERSNASSWKSNFPDRSSDLFKSSEEGDSLDFDGELEPVFKPAYMDNVQLQSVEEDEPIQNKSVQRRVNPDEEETQMKSVQRAEIPEEELQDKPAQRVEDEEEQVGAKSIQRVEEEDELIQPKASSDSTDALQNISDGSKSQLPKNLQQGIFNETGMELNNVNVHYNSGKPAQLKAHAYTKGNNIYMAPGQEKHLSHEAWHVVQQREGRVQSNTSVNGVGINDDSSLEHEADVMGEKVSKVNSFTSKGDAAATSTGFNTGKAIQRQLGTEGEGGVEKEKDFVPKHDASAFDKTKAAKVHESMVEAYKMIGKGKANIAKDNATYKLWMDAGTADTGNTQKRVEHVKSGFEKIEKCLKEDEVTLKKYALKDDGENRTFAYILRNEKAKNIYLGGAYWNASVTGFDSKAGTIIHELSHKLYGTKDHVYGRSKAKKLAISTPSKATTNADNYEYLSEGS